MQSFSIDRMKVAGKTVTRYGIALSAIVLLGLLLRVYQLGAQSVWDDEAHSIFVAKMSVSGVVRAAAPDTHPPLYYLLLHYWITPFGTSESAVRLLSALFGVLAIPMAYLIGRQLFDKEAGLWGALLLAISSFNIYYSQETRMYSLMVLLALVSIFFFLRLLQRASTVISVGYVLSTALLMYTHVYGLLVLVIQNVYLISLLLLSRDVPLQLRRWIPLQATVVALFVPWVGVYLARPSVIKWVSWIPRPTIDSIITTLIQYSGAYADQQYITNGLFALFLGLSVFSLFTVRKMRGPAPGLRTLLRYLENAVWEVRIRDIDGVYLLAVWMFAIIAIPFAVSLTVTPIYQYKYTIAASVALYLLVAAGIRNINNKYTKAAVVGLVVVLCSTSVQPIYGGTWKVQAREAINVINENATSGDLVIADGLGFGSNWEYYNKTNSSVEKVLINLTARNGGAVVQAQNDSGVVQELQAAIAGHDRVWFLSWTDPPSKPTRTELLVAQSLNDSYKPTEYPFKGYHVYLFEKRT